MSLAILSYKLLPRNFYAYYIFKHNFGAVIVGDVPVTMRRENYY